MTVTSEFGAAAQGPRHKPGLAGIAGFWKRVSFMPPLTLSAARVRFSPLLFGYFALVVAGALASVVWLGGPRIDLVDVVALSAATLVASYFSVSSLASMDVGWSTAAAIWIAAVVTLGPRGVIAVVIADAIGFALRYRIGWFKATFNAAMHQLEAVAAYLVFVNLQRNGFLAGSLAGLVDLLVNSILLLGVIWAAHGKVSASAWLRDGLSYCAYYFVYGLAAAAVYVLHQSQGPLAYVEILGTPLALQGFLVFLARRVYRFNKETQEHQEARVRLLQQAIEASNTERERIAASIHDSVVQDLVGLTFTLGAYAGRDVGTLTEVEKVSLMRQIAEGSETARKATHDLRTLMIEIASPKLKQAGLRAAIEDLLHNVSANIKTEFTMSTEMESVSEAEQGLVYRVAQEGIRNATKYSRAHKLSVQVKKTATDITLLIVDDGKGFDQEQRLRRQGQGHVGLTLLERTVKDGGGHLEVRSQPGSGTRLTMSIPASA